MVVPEERFIGSVVGGKSFADIGGLWGTVNEKVTVAHQNGAASLTMVDITPQPHPFWTAFLERMKGMDISNVECISADILALGRSEDPPTFDTIYCSGVLYHLPNPVELLVTLHRMTREHLILSSSVTPEIIENEAGRLRIPSSTAIFVPALDGKELDVLRTHWARYIGDTAIGLTRETVWNPADFGPWWWLPTVSCLKSMCLAVGFELIDEAPTWNGLAHVMLLSKRTL